MARENLYDDGGRLPYWMGGHSVGQVGFDFMYNAGNMAPSIAVGLINPVAGAIVQGSAAAGAAYTSAVNQGFSRGQASAYGTLVGISEGSLQYLLGGLAALGGRLSTKAASKLLGKINNAYLKIGAKFGGNLLFEGGEEWLQTSLDGYYRNLALMEENEINLLSEDAIYSGMLGALSAGFFETPGMINSVISGWHNQNAAEIVSADARDKLNLIIKRSTMEIQSGFSCFPEMWQNACAKKVHPQKYIDNNGNEKTYFDVAMHGLPQAVGFWSESTNMSPHLLAEIIRHNKNYGKGQRIRLLSCETGKIRDNKYCFAEELANAIGVAVIAPNKKLYIYSDGEMKIGKHNEGKMIEYKPNERRRFK